MAHLGGKAKPSRLISTGFLLTQTKSSPENLSVQTTLQGEEPTIQTELTFKHSRDLRQGTLCHRASVSSSEKWGQRKDLLPGPACYTSVNGPPWQPRRSVGDKTEAWAGELIGGMSLLWEVPMAGEDVNPLIKPKGKTH